MCQFPPLPLNYYYALHIMCVRATTTAYHSTNVNVTAFRGFPLRINSQILHIGVRNSQIITVNPSSAYVEKWTLTIFHCVYSTKYKLRISQHPELSKQPPQAAEVHRACPTFRSSEEKIISCINTKHSLSMSLSCIDTLKRGRSDTF